MKAVFLFKGESIRTNLDDIDIFRLEKSGIKSIIGSLRTKVWTGLKLRGEKVTPSELKFKGITLD